MVLTQQVYERLVNCPLVPPETGGILGSRNGVVCDCWFDNGCTQMDRAVYTPDVNRLNVQIAQWEMQGVRFSGMFHSHPLDQPTLSTADKDYIRVIFQAMPSDITQLFFPVVLPGKQVIAFKGVHIGGTVCIQKDNITVI